MKGGQAAGDGGAFSWFPSSLHPRAGVGRRTPPHPRRQVRRFCRAPPALLAGRKLCKAASGAPSSPPCRSPTRRLMAGHPAPPQLGGGRPRCSVRLPHPWNRRRLSLTAASALRLSSAGPASARGDPGSGCSAGSSPYRALPVWRRVKWEVLTPLGGILLRREVAEGDSPRVEIGGGGGGARGRRRAARARTHAR